MGSVAFETRKAKQGTAYGPQSTKDYDKLSLFYLPYRRASGDGFLCG
jgi:hypothetical protein